MYRTRHKGRLLRLFRRGHREEPSIIKDLERIGLTVDRFAQRLYYDPVTHDYFADANGSDVEELIDVTNDDLHIEAAARQGLKLKQFRFSDHGEHFGGSSDGVIRNIEKVFPDWALIGPGLAEYKTHGDKSFAVLAGKVEDWRKYLAAPDKHPFTGKGLLTAKLEHYIQMQVYMKYFNLQWGLYVAVNKNSDDLYMEIVQYRPEMGEAYSDRAGQIIAARHPPPRISNNPSWWECKFCDFREICHRGETPQKNCRSCIYAVPTEGGTWYCENYHQLIPKEFIPQGCDSWNPITQ